MGLPMTSASCVLLFLACVSLVLASETMDRLTCNMASESYQSCADNFEMHLTCSLSERNQNISADMMTDYCTVRLKVRDEEMFVCVDITNSRVFLVNGSRDDAIPWRPIEVPNLLNFFSPRPTPGTNFLNPNINKNIKLLYTDSENVNTQKIELDLAMDASITLEDLTPGDMSIFPVRAPSEVNITLLSRLNYDMPCLSPCESSSCIQLLLYKDVPAQSIIFEACWEDAWTIHSCTVSKDGDITDCPKQLFTFEQNGTLVLNQTIPNQWTLDTVIGLELGSGYYHISYIITIFLWNAQLDMSQTNPSNSCNNSKRDDLELTCTLTPTFNFQISTYHDTRCFANLTEVHYSWTNENSETESLGPKLKLRNSDSDAVKYTCKASFTLSTNCSFLHQDTLGPFHLSLLTPDTIERGHKCPQTELEDLKNKLEKGNTSISDALDAVNETLTKDGVDTTSLVSSLADVLYAAGELAKTKPVNEATLKKSTELVSTTLNAMTTDSSETDRSKVFLAMEQLSKSALKNNLIGTPIKKKNVEIYQGRENGSAVQYQIGSGNKTDSSSKEVSFKIKRVSTTDLNSTFALVVFTGHAIVDSSVTFDGQDSKDQEKNPKKINSVVMSIVIEPYPSLADTSDILTFNLTSVNTTGNSECAFLINSSMKWSDKGCKLVGSQDGSSTCHCDHLTNFALLISPYRDIPTVHSEVLSVISTVGCALSILFLCVCLLAHALLWKYVKSDRTILHVHLSILLVIGYIVFLAGVDKTDNEGVCMTVTILLHYVFLVAFCVMLSEGVEILVTVLVVLNRGSILTHLLVMSYGLPVLVVAITLGATQADGYHGDDFCWLAVDNGVFWSFLGPVALILVANLVIVVVVVRTLLGTSVMRAKEASQRLSSVVKAISVLSPIMGLTWVLGFFSVNQGTLVFQYTFAVLNSLQGCFIFVFHCVLNRQMREGIRSRRRRYRARSMDSSGQSSGPKSRSMSLSADSCFGPTDVFKQPKSTPKLVSINKTHTDKV